jgi:two-component system, cell cycle response regulator
MQSGDPKQVSTQEKSHPPQRILVVDHDGALHRRVAAACSNWHYDANIARVDSFLKAMGQVVKPLANKRDELPYPHVLVGYLDHIQGQLSDNAQALKELSPNTRLILIAPADVNGQAERALAAGFDDILIEPIGDETLVNAIHRDANATATNITQEKETAPQIELEVEVEPNLAIPATPFDTSVIKQILNPHGTALADALNIIRQQPGLAQVQLSDPAKKPWHHVAAEVELNGKKFGSLHAPPPAEAQQLQPWANWLAHWHALQNQVSDLWLMSMTDELTGSWNLRYFNRHLQLVVDRAAQDQSAITLMLFDIDNFKQYNDQFGHGAGDDILCETVRLMKTAVREHDVVARIGGDEFAVVFWDAEEPRRSGSQHPVDIKRITSRFRRLIRNYSFPKLAQSAPGKLTISAGLAGFPIDGKTPQTLIEKADEMLMDSKRQGKDAIQFGPGAMKNGFSDGD